MKIAGNKVTPNGGKRGQPRKPARKSRAKMLHAEGYSFSQIGADLGVTRQRAWQLVRK